MEEHDDTHLSYDAKYGGRESYRATRPSLSCLEVLRRMPAERPLRLLDVGCGEGRNAAFFARKGDDVQAFDLPEAGVRKAGPLAKRAGVTLHVFRADLNTCPVTGAFDTFSSTGELHASQPPLRQAILGNYQGHTTEGGIQVFSVFVRKPVIAPAPGRDPTAQPWRSGELFTHDDDWRIARGTGEIFDCLSSGVPHPHAVNRMAARKPAS